MEFAEFNSFLIIMFNNNNTNNTSNNKDIKKGEQRKKTKKKKTKTAKKCVYDSIREFEYINTNKHTHTTIDKHKHCITFTYALKQNVTLGYIPFHSIRKPSCI